MTDPGKTGLPGTVLVLFYELIGKAGTFGNKYFPDMCRGSAREPPPPIILIMCSACKALGQNQRGLPTQDEVLPLPARF